MKRSLMVLAFLLNTGRLFSQLLSATEVDFDKIVQDLLKQQDLPDHYEDLYDVLFQYYTTPMELNKATREDLEGLYVLTPAEVTAFLEHKEKYGAYLSIYELQAIKGWDLSTIKKIQPFVRVTEFFDKEKFLKRIAHNSNHFLIFRTDYVPEKRKGYLPGSFGKSMYQGSPYKHLIRYKNSVGRDFSVGVTMEKDAGEPLRWNPTSKQYLMDYVSFHVCLFNKGKWKAIGLGDYTVQFGQGLVFGGGFYMGKSAETILSVKKNSRGLLPYSSVMESGFFRGICVTYSVLKTIEATGFYSNHNRDAGIHYDSLDKQFEATSLNDYGMHRTEEEIRSKKNMNEQAMGGNISFNSRKRKFHSGVSVVHTLFQTPIVETDRIYNRFDFKGKQNSVVSTDFSAVWQNITAFGEGAISSGSGTALIAGAIGSLSSKLDVSFLYRNFDKNFHSFYADAFSEGSNTANERGMYWGLRIKPNGKWILSGYYDRFVFPWLGYFKDSPSEGDGYLGRVQYNVSKKIQLYYQLRFEESGKNQSDNTTPMDYLAPTHKYNSMWNLDCKAERITLRSRVQWSSYRQSNAPTRGFVVAQDFQFDFRKFKLSTRYCLFDTDDYDNRQYVYEKDVLYAVSFPALHGRGARAYLILQLKAGKQADLWIRYAVTHYTGQSTIGSGWDEIEGDTAREFKIQVRYRFK